MIHPAARHALRGGPGQYWRAAGLLAALTAVAAGYLLQRWWMEMPAYALTHPASLSRWLTAVLVAGSLLWIPWSAVRGAAVISRLRVTGALRHYRLTTSGGARLTGAALTAALAPCGVTLAATLALGLAAAAAAGEPGMAAVLLAHLVLLLMMASAALLGAWLSDRFRLAGTAGLLAALVILAAAGEIALLDRFYPLMKSPEFWIYLALLPNPATAVGSVLGVDLLRIEWIYRHIHAHDYFYVYPPIWQTGLCYGVVGGLFFLLMSHRLGAGEA